MNSLKTYKLGSKNLPGALKWHCSYYWNHVESLNSSLHTKTLSKLEKSLAIPIMANKDLDEYHELGLMLVKQLKVYA